MQSSAKEKPGFFRRISRPFLTGLLAIFPLVITLGVIYWLADLVRGFLGPSSGVGRVLSSIGLKFVTSEIIAYLIGISATLALIYFLGVLVEAGMKKRWHAMVDKIMDRVPLVSKVYDAAKQVMRLFERKDESELKAMSPVLCHFGGEGGTTALALMPSPERIRLNGRDYHAILIPTAPVPFGGGLLYVPAEWVKPVDFAFDGLFNVYMSMGVTSPDYLKMRPDSQAQEER